MPATSQPHTVTKSWCIVSYPLGLCRRRKKPTFCLLDCRSLAGTDGLCTVCCRESWVCWGHVLNKELHTQQLGSSLLHLGIPAPKPAIGKV